MKTLKPFRKISKLTAFFFSVYFTLFSSISYAQYSETAKPAQDYFQIAIPQELGTISNSYFTSVAKSDLGQDARPSAGMIIHIQDAHGQLSAQKNIQQILELLVLKYGFKTVFLEGGLDGKISPDLLRFFKNESVNEKVANQLLEDGHIEGADVFLLKSKGKVSAYGLESEKLYRKNILAFREVISQKKDADVFLAELKNQITSFGSHYFNPDLNKFSKEWLEFQDNRAETLRHLEILDLYANKYLKINLHEAKKQFDYPQLVRIFSIKKMEKDYGGESVRPQLQKDLKRLKKWLAEKKFNPVYAQMFESLVNYSYSSLNPSIPVDVRSFLENFYAVAKPKGFSFSNYYVFMKYLGLLLLAQELEPERLFDEIKKMNVEILKSLANTPEENSLVRLIRDFYLVKKLFALELTRDEYAEIVEKEKIISPVILASRLRMLDNAKIKAKLKVTPELTDLFRSSVRFYDIAGQREDKMFNSMLSVLEGKQEKKIILVTGGFHSRGLETLMRGQNFSFIEVMPKMSEIQSSEKYIEQMLAGASTVPAVSPGKIPLNRIRSLMGEEDYQYFQRAIEKAKAASLGTVSELEKADIFTVLESELEKIVGELKIPENLTSADQHLLAQAALPIVERWIRENQSVIESKMPSMVGYPFGDEQYHRNQVAGTENLGIYAHVWRPGGETRIHDHSGLLGITVPLTDGMEEDQFNFAQESDFGNVSGTVVEMARPVKNVLQKGHARVITKGTGAIHRIRNASSGYGVMLEIYFWQGKSSVKSVNTFVPVEGSTAQYLVRQERVDEINVSLVDKLAKGAREAVSWMILQRLNEAKKHPEKIKELLPMYTTGGTAIVDLLRAIDFIGVSKFSMPKIMVERQKPYTYLIDPNSRSQHGASLGEKADSTQVRTLLSQHINGLMVIPTLHVLANHGIFKLFGSPAQPKEVKLMEIATVFNLDDPYQNLGNLYGGMRTLALQGYVKIKDVDEKTSYQLTEQGWAAFQQAESGYFREVVEALPNLKNYHTLFRGPPNETAVKEFQQIVALIKSRPQIANMIMSPVMVALGMPLFEEQQDGSIEEVGPAFFDLFDGNNILNLDSISFQHNSEFLKTAFELLASQGLAEFKDGSKKIVSLTALGKALAKKSSAYGVTNAYLKFYEKLDDALFGNPYPVDIDNDAHIDRVMDIWGSSGSHENYIKINDKGKGMLAMIKNIFDAPLNQQPEGIADMGCGDGKNIMELAEFIIHHTERGKNLDKFPLAIVAADYSLKSVGRAMATLEKLSITPGVYVEVMRADVTNPAEYDQNIQKHFAARGLHIGMKDLLHTQMFLPHERRPLQVKTREEAQKIIRDHLKSINREALAKILKVETLPLSEEELLALIEKQFTVSYSAKGRLTPGIVAAADLIQFISRWVQYTPKGFIILDLHTARLEEVGNNKFMLPAYWGTHWISQHIMPYVEHNLCLFLAGLESSETVLYPPKTPHAVSLSNYLPSQIAKAASLGRINNTGTNFKVTDKYFSDDGGRPVDRVIRKFKSDLIHLEFELNYYGELAEIESLEYEDYLEIKEEHKEPLTLTDIEKKIADLERGLPKDVQPSMKIRLQKAKERSQLLSVDQELKSRLDVFFKIDEQLAKVTREDRMKMFVFVRDHFRKGEVLPHAEIAAMLSKKGERPVKTAVISDWLGGRKGMPAKYLFRIKNIYEASIRVKRGSMPAGSSLGMPNTARGMRHVDRLSWYSSDELTTKMRKSQAEKQSDYFRLASDLLYVSVMLGAYEYLSEIALARGLDLETMDHFFRKNMFYADKVRGKMEFASPARLEEILDEVESQINISLYSGEVNLPEGADKILRDDVEKLRERLLHEVKENPLSGQVEIFRTRLFSPLAEKRRSEGERLKDRMEEKKISALQLFKFLEPDIKPNESEKERRREKVDKWQKGLSSIPLEIWSAIEKYSEKSPEEKGKLKVSKPFVPVPEVEMVPVAASSLGRRDLGLAYKVAGAVASGIVRFENPLEASAFAEMASAEEAAKYAQFAPSEAAKAFNQDIFRFLKKSNFGSENKSGESQNLQDPFVLITFTDAFGDPEKIDDAALAAKLAKSLHLGDLFVHVWKAKTEEGKPTFLDLLRKSTQGQITVNDLQVQLATDDIIQSQIGPRDISPVSVSSLDETRDLDLKLNGAAKVKFNLKILQQKGIDPTQVIALIRHIGSTPLLRGRIFQDYGFDYYEKEKGKGFWVVGAAFAQKLEEIYAKSLGDKAIARAA